eukprot:scaffold10_cov257-Pinguiococcus_pyrenoidosus.AAC.3
MSDRSAPTWPAEYGEEPGWWPRVRSAYADHETTLDLFECKVGPEGGKALVERGLPCLPQLTNLNLGADEWSSQANCIGPEGAIALATQGLPKVPRLSSLGLGDNRIGPKGAAALATQGLPHLNSLGLGDNRIGPKGAAALATQGLPHVTQLTSLDLWNNGIGDEGVTALATALRDHLVTTPLHDHPPTTFRPPAEILAADHARADAKVAGGGALRVHAGGGRRGAVAAGAPICAPLRRSLPKRKVRRPFSLSPQYLHEGR